MRAAPAFDCAACGRRIGKTAGHNVTDDGRVLCTRCLGTKRLHPNLYPDCPVPWHDLFDHARGVAGTRAGVAAALGLWPVRTAPTFGQWLAGREDDDNAIGDLARDVASDVASGCVAEPSTPEDCRTHVEDVHAAAGYVLDVVARAADEWRAAGMTAGDAFGQALLEIAEHGRATPCQGRRRDRWTSDDAEHRGWAATVCVTLACPVLLQCHAAADEHDEKHGVWGGRDRTAATTRRRAAAHE